MTLESKIYGQDNEKPGFDSDFSQDNEVNIMAARANNLIYDSKKSAYVDEDGCLIIDEFGQKY